MTRTRVLLLLLLPDHTVGSSTSIEAPPPLQQPQPQQHEPLADDYLFTSSSSSTLSHADLQICQRLDQEYERALEERDIGYHARYASVRQSACCSLMFMICFLTIGTMFFTTQAGWQIRDALFFSIYTMTTVGYGLKDAIVPNHTQFQLFVICYIFVGIATLTIMVAQVYQLVQLEASRAQHARDRADNNHHNHRRHSNTRNNPMMRMSTMMMMRGKHGGATTIASGDGSDDMSMGSSSHSKTTFRRSIFSRLGRPTARRQNSNQYHPRNHLNPNPSMMGLQDDIIPNRTEVLIHHFFRYYDRVKRYFTHSDVGRGISVLFPFAGLILIGAVVVGPMEGWTVVESIYFSVVSLTTVGYGLYVPQNPIAIYFCILWLPFSVGFMSLFLGNVAAFYIRMSDKNIARLERQMRRRIQKAKEDAAEQQQKIQHNNSRRHQNHIKTTNTRNNKSHSSRIHASGRMLTNRTAAADAAAASDDVIVRASEGLLPEDKSYHNNNHEEDDDDNVSIVSTSTTGTNNTSSTKRMKRGDFEILTEMDDTMSCATNTSILASNRPGVGGMNGNSSANSPTTSITTNNARRDMILANSHYHPSASSLKTKKNHDGNHCNKATTSATANCNHGINKNDTGDTSSSSSQTMQTMRDILRRVHYTISQKSTTARGGEGATLSSSSSSSFLDGDEESIRSNTQFPTTTNTAATTTTTTTTTSMPTMNTTTTRSKSTKPAFSLRVLVQERFAEIIATDIAGFQSRMEIKDTTLSVTIDTLTTTADKWFIPRRARKAFRSVAFEALYFVGEHGLITRGPDALYDLTPFEFHGLFSPLLAAMGDAHTMETWLANTNVLAEVDLKLHGM